MWHAFIFLLTLLIRLLRAACKPRDELALENLALRQQVAALMLATRRPTLHDADRAFWVALRKTWSTWTSRLVVVPPETVVDWQKISAPCRELGQRDSIDLRGMTTRVFFHAPAPRPAA
jgi:hypothetical protein